MHISGDILITSDIGVMDSFSRIGTNPLFARRMYIHIEKGVGMGRRSDLVGRGLIRSH